MIEALALAGGLVGGVELRLLVLLGAAIWMPIPTAVAVLVAVMLGRRDEIRSRAGGDVRFAETVAGELRAGASLRAALRVACAEKTGGRRIVRRLDVGEPLPEAIEGIEELVPSIGSLIQAAVGAGGGSGRMVPIFEELVVHASAEEAARAEMRAAVAPVKASMTVMVGAPVAYMVWSAATGRLARLMALPGGVWLASIGGALFLFGVLMMVIMARRAR